MFCAFSNFAVLVSWLCHRSFHVSFFCDDNLSQWVVNFVIGPFISTNLTNSCLFADLLRAWEPGIITLTENDSMISQSQRDESSSPETQWAQGGQVHTDLNIIVFHIVQYLHYSCNVDYFFTQPCWWGTPSLVSFEKMQ